eukprot:TRINITY_DN937_c0_g1_i1.p1 TRINITY_DN937_c0_g1~~TRINITY_DN937_c0_g1_i1.p1  ORF type:complete len:356 (+),score=68.79 TRINITY_DN937_c0_g1_i1:46-1113(+)
MCSKRSLLLITILLPVILYGVVWYGTHYSPLLTGMIPAMTRSQDFRFHIDNVTDDACSGKTYLVTGANVGLGLETAKMLIEKGGKVVITCRTTKKCRDAVEDMGLSAEQQKRAVILGDLDLSSIESVKEFVESYKNSGLSLDVLILNAGTMANPYTLSSDGIELQIAVNHFGHAALTFGLLETLLASEYNPRIVIVSSGAVWMANDVYLTMEQVNDEATYSPNEAYGRSKLANYHFGVELQERINTQFPNKNVFVNILHPGTVSTALTRNVINEGAVKQFISSYFWDARTGAFTQVALAVDPSVEEQNIKGKWFYPIFREMEELPTLALNEDLRKKYWDFTVQTLENFGVTSPLK